MVPTPRHTVMLFQGLAAHRNKAPTRGLSHEQTPHLARLTLDGDAAPAITQCPAPRPPPHDMSNRCKPSTVPAKQAPPHPTIDADDTDAAPLPTPGCRLKNSPLLTQPGRRPPPLRASARATGRVCMLRGVKRRAGPCPVKHLSRRGATTPLSPLPHWLHGGQGHCAAALAAATQPWWSGGGLTHELPPPKGRDK